MKFKVTIFALLLAVFATSSALAATRHAAPGGSVVADCLDIGTPCTIERALAVADQGDTILLATGTYTEGELVIDKEFLTITGPLALAGVKPRAGGRPNATSDPLVCVFGTEACIDASGFEFAFSIEEDNVTIEFLSIEGDTDTYALIQILGGYDRWEIGFNYLFGASQKNTGSDFNHSYAIYGDSQTSSGTVTMTGNEIHNNLIIELGRQALVGANTTAGMGIRLEGIEGESSECNDSDKFDCGVWIHDNEFEDLAVGQNSLNFSFDVNGKEPAVAITVNQDPQNDLANNGAVIEDNTYSKDSIDGDQLDFGIVIETGDSQINELDSNFTSGETDVFVVNINRAATIAELLLADFSKSLNPDQLGPGSDA